MNKNMNFMNIYTQKENNYTNMKKIISIILIILLISSNITIISADTNKNAINISSALVFNCLNHKNLESSFKWLYSNEIFYENEVLNISWQKQQPKYLCLQFNKCPENITLIEYHEENIINKYTIKKIYDQVITLNNETTKVQLVSYTNKIELNRILAYTEGILPEPFYNWIETPDRLDYLVIGAHPDDDVLFMGSVIPTLQDQGYIGTTVYITTQKRVRISEALSGTWCMGSKYQSIFLHFPDIPQGRRFDQAEDFKEEDVTLALVRLFREKKPFVVFSHDVKGEYGHWQHVITSSSVVNAAKLAADKSYDEKSYNEYGTWEVKKVYLHLYNQNTYQFNIHTSIKSLDGKTAYEVAKIAFTKHESQAKTRYHVYDDNEKYAMSKFGMIYGTVDVGDNIFDNINQAELYSSLTYRFITYINNFNERIINKCIY